MIDWQFRDPIEEGLLNEEATLDSKLIKLYKDYVSAMGQPPAWVVFKGENGSYKKKKRIHYSGLGRCAEDLELYTLEEVASELPYDLSSLTCEVSFEDRIGSKVIGVEYELKNFTTFEEEEDNG